MLKRDEVNRSSHIRDLDRTLTEVASKKLIFTVTAGRTGTRYVAELFKTLDGVCAIHEDEPSFSHVMRPSQGHPDLAERWVLGQLLPHIAATRHPVYVRTEHLTCKGFLEPLLALGLRPAILLLRRSPRRVARSYLDKDTVPGRTSLGVTYMLHPTDPGVLPLPEYQRFSDYQLCFWYALEIERRQLHYGQLFHEQNLPVEDVTAEELNDLVRWMRCLRTLGLGDRIHGGATALRHMKVTLGAWNMNARKLEEKIDYDREEEEVWTAIARFEPCLRASVESRYTRGLKLRGAMFPLVASVARKLQ